MFFKSYNCTLSQTNMQVVSAVVDINVGLSLR